MPGDYEMLFLKSFIQRQTLQCHSSTREALPLQGDWGLEPRAVGMARCDSTRCTANQPVIKFC